MARAIAAVKFKLLPFLVGILSGVFLMELNKFGNTKHGDRVHSERATTTFLRLVNVAKRHLTVIRIRERRTSRIDCTEGNIKFLFIVMSSPTAQGAKMRQLTRQTIYKNLPIYITLKYVLGTKGINESVSSEIARENVEYNDLLLFDDHVDDYYQLPKKILLSIRWAAKKANHFDYFFKTDDDALVRVDRVVTELIEELNCPKDLYWGHMFFRWKVVPDGKWGESKWYLCETFLPYNAGLGYILSRELVTLVAAYSDHLRLYRLEDASMGLWLAPYRLKLISDWDKFETHFSCSDLPFIIHQFTYQKFKASTDKLYKTGKLC